MIRARSLVAAGAALLVAGSLAACGNGTGSGGSGSQYQLGFSSDLSGKYALNGVGQRDGFKAYFDYVNSKGGINGHKVNVTVTDDASDVTRGTTNTTRLMTANHVSGVAGYILSNVCGAAAVLAKAHKVPIDCGATSDDLMSPVQPYTYAMQISQSNEAGPIAAMGQKLVAGKSKPRVAIIIFASAASVSLGQGLQRIAKTNGWDVVTNVSVPLTATDVSAQAAKVLAAKPDVVLGALYDPLAVSFMRSLEAAKVSTPFVDYDGASLKSGLEVLKDPNFYALSAKTLDGSGSGTYLADLRAAAKLDGKSVETPYFVNGYIQALEFGESLKTCGFPCSGEQLQKSMDKLDVDTQGLTSGNVSYSATDHTAIHSASIYVWDKAKNAAVVALKDSPGSDGNA
jgi:branched-chain amino acid transport system substrate-binding protein